MSHGYAEVSVTQKSKKEMEARTVQSRSTATSCEWGGFCQSEEFFGNITNVDHSFVNKTFIKLSEVMLASD